ncbi:MAG TPA: glycosyltransferase family 2 protein, partial [Patescibacteria group bacterium]|nr:glycosyltransferase family 2 protein [Patescibacteria group bacterium]
MIIKELTAEEKRRYRRLEYIPGILIWTTFAAVIILSFIRPYWAIIFIIAFDLYWMLRIFYLLVYLLTSYKRLKENIKIDWMNKLRDLPNWERIHHLIVLPTYKEEYEIIEGTLEALIKSRYPLKKMIVVLAGEERDEENFKNIASLISAKYGDYFYKLLITIHPKNISGEAAAKGANIHWAGHQAQEFIDQANIPYQDIIVSCFDIDTIVHRQYFAALAFQYLTHPNPLRASFQPIALYNNNIWDSPALMRVVANSTSFWLLTELVRPERLFTFSSHSMSFQALVDVGFWDNTIVTEDSRIFLQCFLRYDGDYKVTPLYMPVSMDTVLGKTLRRSLVNQYKQQRRWAWGVEHLPFMIWNFRKNPKIPRSLKIR